MSDIWFICYTNPVPKNAVLKWGYKICEECLINWIKAEAQYEFIKAGDPNRDIDDAIRKQEGKNYSTITETIKWVNVACQKDSPDLGDEESPEEIHHRLTYEEWLDYIQKSEKQQYKDSYAEVMLDLLTPNSRTLIKWPKENCSYIGYINPRRKCDNELEWEIWDYSWTDPSLIPFCK